MTSDAQSQNLKSQGRRNLDRRSMATTRHWYCAVNLDTGLRVISTTPKRLVEFMVERGGSWRIGEDEVAVQHPGGAHAFFDAVTLEEARRLGESRRCSSCGGSCLWSDDAWTCLDCGDEWSEDHDPIYAAPGGDPEHQRKER